MHSRLFSLSLQNGLDVLPSNKLSARGVPLACVVMLSFRHCQDRETGASRACQVVRGMQAHPKLIDQRASLAIANIKGKRW